MAWIEENKKLVKHFQFDNFIAAVKFINHLTPIAEGLNHHPDIYLYNYNKIKITIYTHTSNELTENDYILANQIDTLIYPLSHN